MDPVFSPKGAEHQRPFITRVVNELIDSWIKEPNGRIEFVERFAQPLPGIVITPALPVVALQPDGTGATRLPQPERTAQLSQAGHRCPKT